MQGDLLTAFGQTKSISSWLQDPLCQATEGELRYRIAMKWRPETAITTPCENNGRTLSRFKGVTWDKSKNRWKAQIKHDGQVIGLGKFKDEVAAARAYDAKCRELRGVDAECNFDD